MKAVGRNLIIQKIEKGITKTDGGLLLSKNDKEDIRYVEADIISIGEEVQGLKEQDRVFYDKHAGHQIEIDKKIYHVIKIQDVVVVL
jgi:co-chaperonin GroES (HSP10)